ncbi:MFS transporter [Paenibacillus larvae]|uniref:MFS transporter n=1 Tax=Paenibacillus larvae TaxID=1464 RepID=A0AAP5MXK3_9BACL|nr:MFS transporter [Paenibacillus larvae]AVF23801.1 multidrug resistance protein [Paenibacillus larvae subsp. larvae]ETK29531.1 multidrug resistance protein [Paenibacillus larvae subsp. larvae DSM 25719]MDE5128390.1 MFS transporter [Paenibacillus larvae subsp. larvae]MDE5136102.1 MFS transporter [Paenibacillus larvae subsp. larvae]MDE5140138.1 MFS transporter [Paenibacillus larvae subsp. larvae]
MFTVFMLTSTAVVPVIGKLSDLYGRKRFYMIGLILFLTGSLLCGYASSMPQFIIYRGIQGIGAGIIMPVTFTLLMVLYPQDKWGSMQALFGITFGLSALVGPLIGAFITEVFHWRWNFFINLPIGLAAFLIIMSNMKENKKHEKPKIDYTGAMMIIAATVTLILSMRLIELQYSWSSWQVLALLVLFIISTIVFILVEKKAQEPIIPLDMFSNRVVSGTLLTVFMQGSTQVLSILFIPMFLTEVYKQKVSGTGVILTVLMLSVMVGSIIGGKLISFMSYRLNLIYDRLVGVATSSVSYFRNIGGIIASAIVGTYVNIQLSRQLTAGLEGNGLPVQSGSSVSEIIDQAKASEINSTIPQLFADSLHICNWILLIGILISILFVSI